MRQKGKGRLPIALLNDEMHEYSDDDMLNRQIRQERMRVNRQGDGDLIGGEDDEMDAGIDQEDVKGKLSLWVQKPDIIKWIRSKFMSFIRTYKDENDNHIYEHRIHEMTLNNRQSLEITFLHLSTKHPTIAIWLAEEPSLILPILNEVGFELALEVYPRYNDIHKEIYIRVKDLPVEDKLRDLRQIHLNAMIKIKGVVTKRTGVFPELQKMYFRCVCGDLKGPVFHNTINEAKFSLGQCVLC